MQSTDYQRFWTNPSFAFVGHTAKSGFPKISFGELKRQGRTVYAIDPSAESIAGEKVYPDFDSLPERVSTAVLELPKEETPVPAVETADHFLDWLQCLRSRKTCNAPIEAGYHHCVPALMAMRALDTGRRQVYDPEKREIRAG